LNVNERDHAGNHQGQRKEHDGVAGEALKRDADRPLRRDILQHAGDLLGETVAGLAAIAAARVERAAQRTDRPVIGRARRHVLGIESVFANTAGAANQ